MKVALSPKIEALLSAKAEEVGVSCQEMVRILLAQSLGTLRAPEGPSGPEGALKVPEGPGTLSATRVEESSSKPSPKEKTEEKTNTYCEAVPEGGGLVLFPDAFTASAKDSARKKREADRETEIAWRISEVWEDYLYAREAFFRDVSGVAPGSVPELRLVRADIRQALLVHDRYRLGAEDRDRWKRESAVRAAGVGIFYDPWCAGTSPQNDARNGGKRYLEAWRPWRPQKGKPDPVTRFAELYFEVRDQEEARRG